jgi:hypothetical protein
VSIQWLNHGCSHQLFRRTPTDEQMRRAGNHLGEIERSSNNTGMSLSTQHAWLFVTLFLLPLQKALILVNLRFVPLSEERAAILQDNIRSLKSSEMTTFIAFYNGSDNNFHSQTELLGNLGLIRLTFIKHQIPRQLRSPRCPRPRVIKKRGIPHRNTDVILFCQKIVSEASMLDVLIVRQHR